MITISVITVSFNAVNSIRNSIEAVASCVNKNTNIEHLIIDGQSTDGTFELIQDYANKFPHIRCISEKDRGQSDAMNKGIHLARGEYIGFLNADDTYTDGTLEFVLDYLNEHQPAFLCGNLNVYDEKNQLLYVSKPFRNSFKEIYFSHTYPINPSSYFYKKTIHEKIGLYNEGDHLTMDLDFILRFINTYKSYTYLDRIFGNFYVGETTKTFQDREAGKMFKRKEALFEHYWKKNSLFSRGLSILKNKLG